MSGSTVSHHFVSISAFTSSATAMIAGSLSYRTEPLRQTSFKRSLQQSMQGEVVGVAHRLTCFGSHASRVRIDSCKHQQHSHSHQLFSVQNPWQCFGFCHVSTMQDVHDVIRCRVPVCTSHAKVPMEDE